MQTKNKRGLLSGALYLALALTVVAILLTAIFTSNKKNDPLPDDYADPRYAAVGDDTGRALDAAATEPSDEAIADVSGAAQPDAVPADVSQPVNDPPAVAADAPRPLIFAMPVEGYIISSHDEDMLVFSPTMNDYRTHTGVDIAAPDGGAVMACADGTVRNVYDDPLMGKCIALDHGNGLVSYYKNLSEQIAEGIAEGVSVARGEVIGMIGSTAMIEISEEPHLHFEMTKNGTSVNPVDYIPFTESEIYEG